MWVFTLGYIFVDILAGIPSERVRAFWKNNWKYIIGAVAALFLVVIAAWHFLGEVFIPASLTGITDALTLSSQKARMTAGTMLHNIFETALTSNPNMRFQTVQATICIVLLLIVLSTWSKGSRKKYLAAQAVYYPVCVIMYVIGLYICYVSVFSYEESVKNSTGYRYLSIIIVFGFIILSGQLLMSMCTDRELTLQMSASSLTDVNKKAGAVDEGSSFSPPARRSVLLCSLLCLLMICNFNSKLIYKASAFHFGENKNYKVIKETKEQIARIEDIITDNDRVYMLSNEYSLDDMNEYPLCVALYYLDNQVSNYLIEPWKYTEDGSIVFVHNAPDKIDDFPAILHERGYTYVWVHSYDRYLQKKFLDMFDCRIKHTGLYEIIDDGNGGMTLRLKEVIGE